MPRHDISNSGTGGYVIEKTWKVLSLNRKSVIVGCSLFIFFFLVFWSSNSVLQTLPDNNVVDQRSSSGESKGKFQGSKPSPEDNQKARKQRLHDYCLTHIFNEKPNREELQYIAVDDKNKILFCALQKVASSTWFKLLKNVLGLRGKRWDVYPGLGEYSEEEMSFKLKTYFKFFFVREPLERLLSAYKSKFIKTPHYTEEIRKTMVQALRPQDYEPQGKNYVSFSEFIQYFSSNISRNQHWRQYEKICHPCVINYDFIGHFETMGADGPVALKMAGIDDRVTFPPIGEATGSDEVLEYYSQVPPWYIKKLGELYRNDFEMFGYEYLGSVKKLFD